MGAALPRLALATILFSLALQVGDDIGDISGTLLVDHRLHYRTDHAGRI
jgi:hypothetical protein